MWEGGNKGKVEGGKRQAGEATARRGGEGRERMLEREGAERLMCRTANVKRSGRRKPSWRPQKA